MNINHKIISTCFTLLLLESSAFAKFFVDVDGIESSTGKPIYKWLGFRRNNKNIWSKNPDLLKWELSKRYKQLYYFNRCPAIKTELDFLVDNKNISPDLAPIIYKMITIDEKPFSYSFIKRNEKYRNILLKLGDKGKKYYVKLAKTPDELKFAKARCRDKTELPWLVLQLNNIDRRDEIIYLIGEYGSAAKNFLPELKKYLKLRRIESRINVADAILKIDPQNIEARKILTDCLKKNEIPTTMLPSISQHPDVEFFKIILSCLKKYPKSYKFPAIICAKKLGQKALPIIVDSIKSAKKPCVQYWFSRHFLENKKISVNLLTPLIHSKNKMVQIWAIKLLKKMGTNAKKALPDLLSLVTDITEHPDKAIQALHSPQVPLTGVYANTLSAILTIEQGDAKIIIDHMIKEKMIDDSNIILFLLLLDKSQKIPKKTIPVLLPYFTRLPKTSKEDRLNLLILKLTEKSPELGRKMLPSLIFLLKHTPASFPSPAPYALWHQKISKDIKKTLSLAVPKISPGFVYQTILEHARQTRDYNKALKLLPPIEKQYIKKNGVYGKQLRQMEIQQLRSGISKMLEDKSNLSKQNIYKLLNWAWRRYAIKVHPSIIPILLQYAESNKKRKKETYYLIFNNINEKQCPDIVADYYIKRYSKEFTSNINTISRVKALESLEKINNKTHQPAIITTFIKGLQDPSLRVITASKDAIGRKKSKIIIPELSKAIYDKDPFIATRVCKFLGRMSLYGKDALPALRKAAVNHPDWTIRASAISALGEIGDKSPEAHSLLSAAMDDKNATIRQNAAKSLIYIGKIPKGDPLLEKILNSGLFKTKLDSYNQLTDSILNGID